MSAVRVLKFPGEARPPKNRRVRRENPLIVRTVAALSSPIPLAVGAFFGGFLPIAGYHTVHYDVQGNGYLWIIVAACLSVSARKTYELSKLAFGDGLTALGFVVCLEGVMSFSPSTVLAVAALIGLILVNAVAAGSVLAGAVPAAKKGVVS